MLEKIPPDRRIFLLVAIGIGAFAGWYLNHDQGVWIGGGAAVVIVAAVLSALGAGHVPALTQALRAASDGVRPVKPLGVNPHESAAFDAIDALAQRIGTIETRVSSAERNADERRGELERLRSDVEAARREKDTLERNSDTLRSRVESLTHDLTSK